MKINFKKIILSKYFQNNIIPNIINIIIAIIILIIFHFIGKYCYNIVINYKNNLEKNEKENINLAYKVTAYLIYYLILLFGFLVILKIFGIETASIIALFGASGIAIGLAFQGILIDLISGILLAIQQTI